jgi:hypothetical protein
LDTLLTTTQQRFQQRHRPWSFNKLQSSCTFEQTSSYTQYNSNHGLSSETVDFLYHKNKRASISIKSQLQSLCSSKLVFV